MDHKNHVDPVCGMRVEKADAAGEYEHEGVMYYFDSDECMARFYKDPKKYAAKADKKDSSDASR